jgi:hypothetical protein
MKALLLGTLLLQVLAQTPLDAGDFSPTLATEPAAEATDVSTIPVDATPADSPPADESAPANEAAPVDATPTDPDAPLTDVNTFVVSSTAPDSFEADPTASTDPSSPPEDPQTTSDPSSPPEDFQTTPDPSTSVDDSQATPDPGTSPADAQTTADPSSLPEDAQATPDASSAPEDAQPVAQSPEDAQPSAEPEPPVDPSTDITSPSNEATTPNQDDGLPASSTADSATDSYTAVLELVTSTSADLGEETSASFWSPTSASDEAGAEATASFWTPTSASDVATETVVSFWTSTSTEVSFWTPVASPSSLTAFAVSPRPSVFAPSFIRNSTSLFGAIDSAPAVAPVLTTTSLFGAIGAVGSADDGPTRVPAPPVFSLNKFNMTYSPLASSTSLFGALGAAGSADDGPTRVPVPPLFTLHGFNSTNSSSQTLIASSTSLFGAIGAAGYTEDTPTETPAPRLFGPNRPGFTAPSSAIASPSPTSLFDAFGAADSPTSTLESTLPAPNFGPRATTAPNLAGPAAKYYSGGGTSGYPVSGGGSYGGSEPAPYGPRPQGYPRPYWGYNDGSPQYVGDNDDPDWYHGGYPYQPPKFSNACPSWCHNYNTDTHYRQAEQNVEASEKTTLSSHVRRDSADVDNEWQLYRAAAPSAVSTSTTGGVRGFLWPGKLRSDASVAAGPGPQGDVARPYDDHYHYRHHKVKKVKRRCPKSCGRPSSSSRRPTSMRTASTRPASTRPATSAVATRISSSPVGYLVSTFVTSTSIVTVTQYVEDTATAAPPITPTGLGYTGNTLGDVCPNTCNPDPRYNMCGTTTSCVNSGSDRYYCACRSGYKAKEFNSHDFSKQFRIEPGPLAAYVFVAPGVECSELCSDIMCTEVMTRNNCA